jgi:hypothetical protein
MLPYLVPTCVWIYSCMDIQRKRQTWLECGGSLAVAVAQVREFILYVSDTVGPELVAV